MTKDDKSAEDIFGDVEVKEDTEQVTEVNESGVMVPKITDPEWNAYVLTLFDESELVDGDTDNPKPMVAGLRRVAELILGRIVAAGPTQVFPATDKDHPGRATVVFNVVFEDGSSFSDVADSWEGNTNDDFVVFTTAIASTRAEARALRKALRLKSVSAEEVTSKDTASIARQATRVSESKKPTDGEVKDDSYMSSKQDSFINTLCDRAKVDRDKFTESFGLEPNDRVQKKIASEMIDKLNGYINGAEEVPTEILN